MRSARSIALVTVWCWCANQGQADDAGNPDQAEGQDFGIGGLENRSEAARWYRAVAEQGVPQAQDQRGLMYGYGDGLEQDFAAAPLGDQIAQLNLGLMHLDGRGVRRNRIDSRVWLRVAGKSDNPHIAAAASDALERANRCPGPCDSGGAGGVLVGLLILGALLSAGEGSSGSTYVDRVDEDYQMQMNRLKQWGDDASLWLTAP